MEEGAPLLLVTSSLMNSLVVPAAHHNSCFYPHTSNRRSDLILCDGVCRVNPVIPESLIQFPRCFDRVLVLQDHREFVEVSLLSLLSHLIIRLLGNYVPDSD